MQDAKRNDAYVRARALVSRVYRLPEAERDAFIRQSCEGDDDLRREVAWMLEVLRSPEDEFLEQRPLALSPEDGELHVAKPHDYKLVRQIGEGGVGVVYLAERVEGDFKQTVALKLLATPALANHATVSRFLLERQLLARLNHPNIAHLVDAGALSDGRPFLAMEYIDGVRIDEYCIAHEPSLTARLQMCIKICGALQYAHERLVIHRDIKPANILVTPEGEPKLLDFGIGRLLASPKDELTSTVAGQRIMTFAYASPEQIEGKPLSTATDVYSLGVTLYELLSGTHPWGETDNPAEIVRLASRSEPDPPSVAKRRLSKRGQGGQSRHSWTERWRRRELPQDLDATVLKALSRRPEDRYSSAAALGDDLQRFLDNRPVQARRGHRGYRLRKFVRRNRLPLAATAMVMALIAAFAVNRHMQMQRVLAEQAKTAQVRDFMVQLFESSQLEQTQGKEVSAREILDRGMARVHRALDGAPTTRVALLRAMASAYNSLGVRDKAAHAAEEALALARKDPSTSRESLTGLLLLLADVNANSQNATAEERYAREALALAQSDPDADRQSAAIAQKHIANALTRQAKPRGEVEPYFLRAIDTLRRVDPHGEDYLYALQDYGVALRLWDSPKEALRQLKPALDMATAKYGDSDPRTVQIAAEYGLALERSGDPLGAEKMLRRAYDQQIRLYGPDNAATAYVRGYLAFSLMSQRRFAEAEPLLRETLEMGRKHDAVGNSTFNDTMNLGYALRELKRFPEAETLYREALAMVPAAFPPDRQTVMRATVHTYLGLTLQGEGRNTEAEAMLRQALSGLPDIDQTRRTRASAWRGLAAVAMARGDAKTAENSSRRALALYDPNTWWHADAAVDVAQALVAQRRYDDAEPLLLAALKRFDAEFPRGDSRTRRATNLLADLYRREGRNDRLAELRARYAAGPAPEAGQSASAKGHGSG